jgi:hypothetical protein
MKKSEMTFWYQLCPTPGCVLRANHNGKCDIR